MKLYKCRPIENLEFDLKLLQDNLFRTSTVDKLNNDNEFTFDDYLPKRQLDCSSNQRLIHIARVCNKKRQEI